MENTAVDTQNKYPEYLYHYTTVETLAMILKSKKIRLAPLTSLDDLQESKCSEAFNFARFVFVSSWTEDKDESIPMWNLYAKMEHGIRVRLPAMPIAEFELKATDLAQFGQVKQFVEPGPKYILPPSELLTTNYFPFPFNTMNLLQKVIYTSDRTLLEPKILFTEPSGSVQLEMGSLGLHKNTSWEFQKEWRYRIWIAPMSFLETVTLKMQAAVKAFQRMKNDLLPAPADSIFLTIQDQAFSQMEITLNPKISDGSRTIIELLKREYNPTMSVKDSILANTIR